MKWLARLLEFIDDLIINLFPDVETDPRTLPMNQEPVPPPVPDPLPAKKTPREIVVDAALAAIGLDLTPKDEVPDEVACVTQLVHVIKPTPYALPLNLTYTPALKKALIASGKWRGTLEPKSGCIVLSPTEGQQTGHCGLFITDQLIASNNSFGPFKGKWTQNYTWPIWVAKFKKEKQLRIYIFEPHD